MKKYTINADEYDASSRKARRILGGHAGKWKAIKRKMNKRYRKDAKMELLAV